MNNVEDYRIDLEICPTPILLVSSTGEIIRTNTRLDTLFGYQSGELAGKSVEILVPEQIRSYHPDLRNAFFEVPTNRSMGTGRDLHGVRKNGEMLPVEIGLDPIEFHGEQMVMVSVLDIRERKNNEAMIRRAINAASSAMIQVDEIGVIELVNNQTVQLFGYTTDELLGKSIEILVPTRFRRKHTVYRTSYQSNRDTRNMGQGRDLFGLRKDGTEFPIEIGLTPVHEMEGRSTMATIIDITDRKTRERYIEQKNEQLRRLNTELLEFAYSASHDLKAPLASITGLLGFCETDLESGDVNEVLENIQKAKTLANRLATRIEDMLSLAKSDNISAKWEDIIVGDRIEEIWTVLEHDNIELTTCLGHTEPIRSIAVRFNTILENLLSNAIKYRDPASTNSTIQIKTWNEGDNFYMTVEDNGIGIPPEYHDKVFKLFQRVSNNDKPGNGLGLALVKKSVTHLGGEIAFEYNNSRTVFTVILPQIDDISSIIATENEK